MKVVAEVVGWTVVMLAAVLSGVFAWVLIATPSPRMEQVRAAYHDNATFQQLRKKHGMEATQCVVYESDGKAYYFLKGRRYEFK